MVKKEDDFAASGQGWRFINWQLNPHINILLGESSQFQRSVIHGYLIKKTWKKCRDQSGLCAKDDRMRQQSFASTAFPLGSGVFQAKCL
jgi:hypothetical protein